ncbi:MAG TPA: hypothetical protein VG944_14830 [Fimbriimonas sp.]|nr:hypothetical protein [Fimbriimonas sp.]
MATGFVQASQQPTASPAPTPTAASMISQMFKRYSEAKTFTGRVKYTQVAMNNAYTVVTDLAYKRPSLIYLNQKLVGKDYDTDKPKDAVLVSNGKIFEYTVPPSASEGRIKYLQEMVHPTNSITLSTAEMYSAIKATLRDDGLPLGSFIARPYDLKDAVSHLKSFALKGKTTINSVPVVEIAGQWREQKGGTEEGTFELYLNDTTYDLVKLVTHMRYGVRPAELVRSHMPADAFKEGVEVVSTWDCDSKVNEDLDESIFKLPSK